MDKALEREGAVADAEDFRALDYGQVGIEGESGARFGFGGVAWRG